MNKILLIVTCLMVTLGVKAQRVIVVEKNSAESLLAAISEANQTNEANGCSS